METRKELIYIGISVNACDFSLSFPRGREDSRGLASLLGSARRVASRVGKLFRSARRNSSGEAMRAIVALYLIVGVVLLAIGFLLPGPCPNRNTDVVSNIVFALTWPVGLYAEVYQGQLSAQEWLHRQACEGGGKLGEKKPVPD
jgi:hypothetical protein